MSTSNAGYAPQTFASENSPSDPANTALAAKWWAIAIRGVVSRFSAGQADWAVRIAAGAVSSPSKRVPWNVYRREIMPDALWNEL